MADEEFEDLREQEEDKELEFYMSKPASFIEEEIRAGRFGVQYQIWEAVARKCALKDIGWDLFKILSSDQQPYVVRHHCAEALIELSDADDYGIHAEKISSEEQYNVPQYLQTLKGIIERKLAGG